MALIISTKKKGQGEKMMMMMMMMMEMIMNHVEEFWYMSSFGMWLVYG